MDSRYLIYISFVFICLKACTGQSLSLQNLKQPGYCKVYGHMHFVTYMGQDYNGDYKRYKPIDVNGRTVRFFTEAGSQLMLSVQSIDIPNTPSNYVQMYDGSSVTSPSIPGGILRGSKAPTTVFTSSGTDMTLSFHSDGAKDYNFKIDIYLTAFHTGDCKSMEFKCNNGRCIKSSIRCTGANPCGDFSDCDYKTNQPCTYPGKCAVTTKYVEDYCKKNTLFSLLPNNDIFLPLGEQLELKLTRNSTYAPNMDCYPTIISNGKLMVYFKWIDTTLTMGQTDCSFNDDDAFFYDYIALNDGDSEDLVLLGGSRFCGYTAPSDIFVTSGSYLTVHFHGYYLGGGKGFDLIVTPYLTDNSVGDMFRCNNSRYISQSLRCNSFNPCGDHSDGDNITCLLEREQTTPSTTSAPTTQTKLTTKPTTTTRSHVTTRVITFKQTSKRSPSTPYISMSSNFHKQGNSITPCADFPSRCLSSNKKDTSKSNSLSTGAIIGISIGCVVLVSFVVTVAILRQKRHGAMQNKLQRKTSTNGNLAIIEHDYTQLEDHIPTIENCTA